ncbi:Copia protein, partial [Mucuna pruriens]
MSRYAHNDIQDVEANATKAQKKVYMGFKKKDCKALFLIHQYGHFANECYNNKGKQKKESEAQMAQGDSDDPDSDHVKPTKEVAKYKAKLVAKGFLQKVGLDYNEVFATVSIIGTIKLVVVATIFRCWLLHEVDIKLAFQNDPPKEELEKEGSDKSIDASLYIQIVGSLRFMRSNRPDIAYRGDRFKIIRDMIRVKPIVNLN